MTTPTHDTGAAPATNVLMATTATQDVTPNIPLPPTNDNPSSSHGVNEDEIGQNNVTEVTFGNALHCHII